MANLPPDNLPVPLLRALEKRLLPWFEDWGMERCLIAPADIHNPPVLKKWLSTGASVSPSPLRGRRVSVKGPREHGNRSMKIARWPDDHVESTRGPIFVCVLNGEADLQVGDCLVHLCAGHSMVIMPETPRPDGSTSHLVGANRCGGNCELLWLSNNAGSGIGCWICHSQGERHFERPAESCQVPDPGVIALFDLFMTEATSAGKQNRAICGDLFHALLLALCREIVAGRIFQFAHQKAGIVHEAMHSRIQNPIPAAQDYIRANLHLALRIDDVARQMLLSRTEFTQRFRRQTGQSFNEYLTEMRLQEARLLLETTAWSVTSVGRAVGFNSSRLRVLFNRHYGLSPKEYRARHSGDAPAAKAAQAKLPQRRRKVRETRRQKLTE